MQQSISLWIGGNPGHAAFGALKAPQEMDDAMPFCTAILAGASGRRCSNRGGPRLKAVTAGMSLAVTA